MVASVRRATCAMSYRRITDEVGLNLKVVQIGAPSQYKRVMRPLTDSGFDQCQAGHPAKVFAIGVEQLDSTLPLLA